MTLILHRTFANICRSARLQLHVTQADLAATVGVSRTHISAIETGRANPTLGVVARISEALDLGLAFVSRPPVVIGPRQRDFVHARCSAYIERRLRTLGFEVLREVEIVHGRSHGWIDLLAFDRSTGTLIVIEVKTGLDDIGGAERQLGWYERAARGMAAARGWQPRRVRTWLLVLASVEVDAAIRANRDVLDVAFPVRAGVMRLELAGEGPATAGRGLGLIDPSRRRHDWLLPSRIDGRRWEAPYRGYSDAAARWREDAKTPASRLPVPPRLGQPGPRWREGPGPHDGRGPV